ncbi:RHS repeat-associated core domain-containing protein [Pseudomonas sp. OST1909]|uniref:RHS repeat domain-containing protein n=1 Tax=Pseudomonas sp. OST1909 TaxID=2777367 RepID=UPI001889B94C|nr:RHS repeat-associated core domain-containing protein [Pseudomonas sp. OST1909]QOY74004.1 hypothetical protein IH404_13395 [Pseudomonas sp. OST1909]
MAHNPMGTDPSDSENDPIFNATTQKRNVVDPRTGLFEAFIPLPSIVGNDGSGPVFEMGLHGAPTVNNLFGIGDDFFVRVTTYSVARSLLTLHSGETISIKEGVNPNPQNDAVKVSWSENQLTVTRKDKRCEVLELLDNTGIYVPKILTTYEHGLDLELSKNLYFTWISTPHVIEGKTHYQIQLTGITDSTKRNLLKIEYTTPAPDTSPAIGTVKIIFWPDNATHTLTYTLALKDYALQSVTLGDTHKTTLEYLDHPVCGWLLNKITNFDGLQEAVEYKDNGLTFPDNPKLSALPCVSTHTLTPAGGGTPVITTYTYERQDEKKYRTIMTEGVPAIRTTVYQYNGNHDVEAETLSQGSAKTLTTYIMNMDAGLHNRETKVTYQQANRSRTTTNKNSFNDSSGLVKNQQQNITSEMDYLRSPGEPLYNFQKNSAGTLRARALLSAIARTSKQEPNDQPGTPWETEDRTYYSPFASDALDTKFVETPGLLAIIPGLPDLIPTLRNVAKFELYRYEMQDLLGTKLYSTLECSLATDRLADAAFVGQQYEYYEANFTEEGTVIEDFRTGRVKSIRRSTLGNKYLAPLVSDPLRSFAYALGGVGNIELTTTTTETDEHGNSRTSSETNSTLDGRLIRQVDIDGNRTEYSYNNNGQLSTLTVCAQSTTYRQVTTYSYPAPGQIQVTAPNGQTRLSQYDGQDRLVSEYLIEGGQKKQTMAVTYDRIGRELRKTKFDYQEGLPPQLHEWQELKYDDWNQVSGRRYSDGKEDFDLKDPIALTLTQWTGKATDKHRMITTYNLDETIKKIEWKGQDGNVYQTQTATYTRARQIKQLHTDGELGDTTIDYTYDGSGRLLSEKHSEKNNGILAPSLVYTYYYTYPKHWLMTEATQIDIEFSNKRHILGKRTIDSWGRVTSLTRGTCTETYTYIGASSVPASTQTADGTLLQHEYIKELGNRLANTGTTNRTEQQSYTYAYGAQKISSASEGDKFLEYNHDANLHVTRQHIQTQPGQAKETLSDYSMGGRLLTSTDPKGLKSLFIYGADQRRAVNNFHFTCSHDYDSQGLLSEERIIGPFNSTDPKVTFDVTYTYDAERRETSRRFTLSGKVDLNMESAYYRDGKLKSVLLKQDNIVLGSRIMAYTPGGRLKSYTTTGVWRPKTPKNQDIDKQEFTYDALGNVTTCVTSFVGFKNTTTNTYDSLNGFRLTTVKNTHSDYPAAATLSYDAAGRVIQDASGKKYAYDWRGRLSKAGSIRYSYDPSNRLMIRDNSGKQTQLIYDGLSVCGEYSTADNDSSRELNPGSEGCTVLQIKRSGEKTTLFELRDPHGTVVTSYYLEAQTLRHHAYTAYGEQSPAATDSMLGFKGEFLDADTGQYVLGAGGQGRYYSASSMCFYTPDSLSPFGPGGPNLYAYCAEGDPVNFSDPSGHFSVNNALWNQWQGQGREPGPLSIEGFTQFSSWIFGAIGILAAIVSGGTSLVLTAALVGLAVVSLAANIASVIIQDTNPELSRILAWVSLGTGVLGGGALLLQKVAYLALYLGRSGIAMARNLLARTFPNLIPRLRRLGQFRDYGRLYRDFAQPKNSHIVGPIKGDPVKELEQGKRAKNLFTAAEANTVVFITTGTLGNIEAFGSDEANLANNSTGNLTWLPWGSFMKHWLKVR